ncbi:MAG: substrate-binding domain-containing protein [Desulfohalobiaceae bacterium]|nr:substrate-binding domain-containing protein [Desulfohalobiaceae bacterium]
MADSYDNGEYPVIPLERDDDLQGMEEADRAGLILFMAGNQFMALPDLVRAFLRENPGAEPVAWETLPPGLELAQILAGGARFGQRLLPGLPDVYTAVSEEAMQTLVRRGLVREGDPFVYLRNRLGIMVAADNPKAVRGVRDLGREDVRVSQPDPAGEHIALYIEEMYRRAGGEELLSTVLRDKADAGTTLWTSVHHRQTPQRLLEGQADAGPVWWTEIQRAQSLGLALEGIDPGPGLDRREAIRYYATGLKDGPNPENASRFLEFLRSGAARDVFSRHGFLPPEEDR